MIFVFSVPFFMIPWAPVSSNRVVAVRSSVLSQAYTHSPERRLFGVSVDSFGCNVGRVGGVSKLNVLDWCSSFYRPPSLLAS